MILELIGQPRFDLKQNNSKKMYEINALSFVFLIDSLSSNSKDTTAHFVNATLLSCVFFFYIIGTQYLHVRHPGKISPSELVSNSYISNHDKVRRPHPKFKVSFFLLFLNQ